MILVTTVVAVNLTQVILSAYTTAITFSYKFHKIKIACTLSHFSSEY